MSDYLTLAEALAIDDDQLERYGGSAGVRDLGLLEAAREEQKKGTHAERAFEGTHRLSHGILE